MKYVRVILALIITVAMLYIAKTNSEGQPEEYSATDGNYTFHMTSVPKVLEHLPDTIKVTVTGPMIGRRLLLRTTQGVPPARLNIDSLQTYPMRLMHSYLDAPDLYLVPVIAGERGGRFHYWFEIVNLDSQPLARFTRPDGSSFFLRYIGEVPTAVLVGHILFIFATVFFVALATIHGFRVLFSGDGLRPMAWSLFWAAVCCFVGCYPLGIPMNWYAFAGLWEGVPFGTDATDNKTQLLFVYLLFASLSTLGSLTAGKFGRDLFSPKTRGVIGFGSFAVMLFIYLIPHSIQFDPTFTYGFCYTWIAIVAALYFMGRLRSRPVA